MWDNYYVHEICLIWRSEILFVWKRRSQWQMCLVHISFMRKWQLMVTDKKIINYNMKFRISLEVTVWKMCLRLVQVGYRHRLPDVPCSLATPWASKSHWAGWPGVWGRVWASRGLPFSALSNIPASRGLPFSALSHQSICIYLFPHL